MHQNQKKKYLQHQLEQQENKLVLTDQERNEIPNGKVIPFLLFFPVKKQTNADMKKSYPIVKSGETFTLNYKKTLLALACCDCGLVHTMDFNIKKDDILEITITRNTKSTGQIRRRMFPSLKHKLLKSLIKDQYNEN